MLGLVVPVAASEGRAGTWTGPVGERQEKQAPTQLPDFPMALKRSFSRVDSFTCIVAWDLDSQIWQWGVEETWLCIFFPFASGQIETGSEWSESF